MAAIEALRRRRAAFVITVLAVLIIITFLVSMNTGYIRLSPLDVLQTLFGMGTDKQSMILFDFRLPRIVTSVLIGMGFAISGCILQSLSRNPLADPGLLGINSGASLMVVLYISFIQMDRSGSVLIMPIFAFLGSMAAAVIIYAFSYKRHQGVIPTRMILAGVAIAQAINAAILVLTLRINPDQYQKIQIWIAGSINGTSWTYVAALLPWIVILIPYTVYKSRALNVLHLGDQLATGLGSPVGRDRLLLLGAAVGLAGACTAVGGGISFIGLIGPHLARRLVGPNHQQLLPASALCGGLIVMVADTVSRTISEIPTGIIVAVIGAPYFLYLLSKAK
ncbi:FecCD family ABC transporter permease [Paenibacillus protaetiae]|uniref:Iron ABC transporter permease n=1 Tax=Paenibacillus protaetiae TaxID=2509456 RepID=A0A4P6F842_9BACL|nr:iron ABC transporter permease [Paenibacillus protaetiae]QAY66608.1 iron ABC transporter permease [Paenibacillus protaetiae]